VGTFKNRPGAALNDDGRDAKQCVELAGRSSTRRVVGFADLLNAIETSIARDPVHS
jgi:hypothetical protein